MVTQPISASAKPNGSAHGSGVFPSASLRTTTRSATTNTAPSIAWTLTNPTATLAEPIGTVASTAKTPMSGSAITASASSGNATRPTKTSGDQSAAIDETAASAAPEANATSESAM